MAHTQTEAQPRKRRPVVAARVDWVSWAQRAYVTHDPRWPEQRSACG